MISGSFKAEGLQQGESMAAACKDLGVDRSMIVSHAALAELAITDPQKYAELGPTAGKL